MKKLKWLLISIGIIIVVALAFLIITRPDLKATDENNLPQFIQADFIDLDKIFTISKFRSGAGHDFSSGGETCRSMKHYFNPQNNVRTGDVNKLMQEPDPATAIKIYSPVDGEIVGIKTENMPIGRQIYIKPDSAPKFTVRLFHVYPLPNIQKKSRVKAGEFIGRINSYQSTDIAIQSSSFGPPRFYSYFSVMPDSVFTKYQQRGAQSKDEFIISKQERDANPLECNREQFATNYDNIEMTTNHFVTLSGYIK